MQASLVAQMVNNLPAMQILIPGWGRSPGKGNDYPLQYSCLFGRLQITFRFFSFTLLEQMSWVICWKSPLLMVSKCLKLASVSQEQGGGVELLAREPLSSLPIDTLSLSRLWAAAADYFLWSLAPYFPASQSSSWTVFLAQTLCYC